MSYKIAILRHMFFFYFDDMTDLEINISKTQKEYTRYTRPQCHRAKGVIILKL